MLKTFTDDPNHPGDLDNDGILSTTDVSLLEKLVSSFDDQQIPQANAGADQVVKLGATVTLNASASYDPDNLPLPLTYVWAQSGGLDVTLNSENTVAPKFTPTTKGTYKFTLVTNDGKNNSKPDTVTITVVSTPGDIDKDNDVDGDDLKQITSSLNTNVAANDPRDLNGDMKINALDARKLILLCTRPRCATK